MQKKIYQSFICMIVILGLFSRAIASEQVDSNALSKTNIIKNPKDNRRYDSIILNNGLQVLVVSDPETAVSAAALVVGVGSYQNPDSQLGLAHYVEHMLFLGTKKYPEINSLSRFINDKSGYLNAATNLQDTTFLFAIPNESFDKALDYFSDYFKQPLFNVEYSSKERYAINAEWSSGRSNDERIGARILALTGNPKHPLSKFPIGNLDTLRDKDGSKLHDELVKFYENYYSANIMKLALVGKKSTEELKMLAKDHFESIPNRNIPLPQVNIAGLIPENLNKVIYYRPHMDVKKLILQFPAKDNTNQWNLKPNEYVQSLITSNESGGLAQYLREKKLADNVSFDWEVRLYGNSGTYTIAIDLTKEGLKNQDSVIGAIFSYINLIREKGVNELYFSELKSRLDLSYRNAMKEDVLSTANGLAHRLFEIPPEDILYAGYRLDRFDPEAILSVLNQLNFESVRVGHVNKNVSVDTAVPFYDGSYKIRDVTKGELDKWSNLARKITLRLPPENQLLKKVDDHITQVKYEKPHKVVNKLGVQAWFMNSQNFDEKSGFLCMIINPSVNESNVKKFAVSWLLNELFKRQNDSLLSRYSRAGINVNIQITETNAQYIAISGEADKQPHLLKQLLKSFMATEFSEDDVKSAKSALTSLTLNASNAGPLSQLNQYLLDYMVKNRWSNDKIIKAISDTSIREIKSYQRELMSSNTIDILAFGYFDENAVIAVADETLALLGPDRIPAQGVEKRFVVPVAGKKFVTNSVSLHNDNALIDFYVSPTQSPDGLADLYIINSLFNTTMYTELRTKEQLAYILGSYVYNFHGFPGFGISIQSENTDLISLKSRFDELRKEFFNQLKAVDPATVEEIKGSILVQLNQKPNNLQDEASVLVSDFIEGKYDFMTKEKLIKEIRSVSKERLLKTYKSIVLNDNAMNIVLQMKGKKFNSTNFFAAENMQTAEGPEEFSEFISGPAK